MTKINWQDHISVDPDLHHGDPCIKGTRIPISFILGSLANGLTIDEIRAEYSQLTTEDIQAALAYAAQLVRQDILAPLSLA